MSDRSHDLHTIVRRMIEQGLSRDERLQVLTDYVGRPITTTLDLNDDEAAAVAETLRRAGVRR